MRRSGVLWALGAVAFILGASQALRYAETSSPLVQLYNQVAAARALDDRCHLLPAEDRASLDARWARIRRFYEDPDRTRVATDDGDAAAEALRASAPCDDQARARVRATVQEVTAVRAVEFEQQFAAAERLATRCGPDFAPAADRLGQALATLRTAMQERLPAELLNRPRPLLTDMPVGYWDGEPCREAGKRIGPALELIEEAMGLRGGA